MQAKRVIGFSVAAVLGASASILLDSHRSSDRLVEGVSQEKPEAVAPSKPTEMAHHYEATPAERASNWVVAAPASQPSATVSMVDTNSAVPLTRIVYVPVAVPVGEAVAMDPEAREALRMVGADSDAEMYWLSAINNPNLPAEERKDLIEDLNEDGLSDPKHPGPNDMPLIWSRIELLEEIGPDAMDEVNSAAFAEAYKDLVNLAYGVPPN